MSKNKQLLLFMLCGVAMMSLTYIFALTNKKTYLEPVQIYQKIDKIVKHKRAPELIVTLNNGEIHHYKHKLSKTMIRNLAQTPINETHCYEVTKMPHTYKFSKDQIFYEYSLPNLNYVDDKFCEYALNVHN